jgi:uncharacterized protein YciI
MAVPTPDQMTKLFILFLTKGPNWNSEETPESRKLQIEHVEYQMFLRKSGKTLIVGPVVDNGAIRGITLLRVNSAEEVQVLMNEDPAIKAEVFGFEIHPWLVEKEALNFTF